MPAAVRPRDTTGERESDNKLDEDNVEQAGLHAAGDAEENEDLDWIPPEDLAEQGEGHVGVDDLHLRAGVSGESQGNDEEITCEPCGEVVAKTWTNPARPTAAEKAHHDLTHCPYRLLCPVCVEAMGREDPHKQAEEVEESALAVVNGPRDEWIIKRCCKDRGNGPFRYRGEDGRRASPSSSAVHNHRD